MATNDLEVFIAGQWRKDFKELDTTLEQSIKNIETFAEKSKLVRIGFGSSSGISEYKKQSQEAIAIQKELQAQIDTLMKQTKQLETARQQAYRTQQESNKVDKEAARAEQEKSKATQQATKATQEETKSEILSYKALREKNREIREAQKEAARLEAALKKEQAALEKEQGAYARLSKEYNIAAKEAQNLGAELHYLEQQFGQGQGIVMKEAFDKASASAKVLDTELKRIDATVGKHQRSVGDYAKQWNGVQMQIGGLIREVPSTINNLSMLPLALSNQIGPLKDAIANAVKENDRLRLSGQKTIPVWKQVTAAIFSWETAIMLGVAALVYYSSKSGEASKKTEALSSAVKSASNSYAEASFQLNAWNDAFNDSTTTMAQKEAILEEYNSKWGDQAGHLENVNQLEKFLTEKAGAFINTLFLRAQATAALAAATELLTENMKNQVAQGTNNVDMFDAFASGAKSVFGGGIGGAATDLAYKGQKRLGEENVKTAESVKKLKDRYTEFYAQAADAAKKYGFDLDGKKNPKDPKKKGSKPDDLTNTIIEAQRAANEALATLQQANVDAEADRQKSISENEKNSLDDRLKAYEIYYKSRSEIAQSEYNRELEDINLTNEKLLHAINGSDANPAEKTKARLQANETYSAQLEALGAKYDGLAVKRVTDREEAILNITKSSTQEQIRTIMQGAQDIESRLRASENERLILLEQSNLSYKEKQAERKRITADTEQQIWALQHKYFQGYIDELEKTGKITVEVANKLKAELASPMPGSGNTDSKGGLFENIAKQIFGDISDDQASGIVAAYTSSFNEIYSAIQQAISAKYEREIQAHEERIQQIQDEGELELLYLKINAKSQEDYDKQASELKARQLGKERVEQSQIKALKQRQASADKQSNINEIIGKTAIAAMQGYIAAKGNPVLGAAFAAAIIIAGAAQVASVANRPIPQYYKGTKSAQSGTAWVGEKGRELVVGGNQAWLTPNTATLANLKGGERIFTADETDRMLKNGSISGMGVGTQKINEWAQAQYLGSVFERVGEKIAKRNNRPIIHVHGVDASIKHKTQH